VTSASTTAIVVNYRSGDDLATCLAALAATDARLARVVVVDNASGDTSWEPGHQWRTRDPRFELIHADENLGLAGAVDLVLPSLSTPYLAVLNPDATPQTDWLEPLVDVLESDETVAIACPLILVEATGEVNSAGQHLHVTGLGFNRLLHADPSVAGTTPHEVGGFHGSAFLMRASVLRELGGWDDTGFLYHEDVALSWDVALLGLRIVCVPTSRVLHDYHLTMYPEKLYLLERNRWALVLSHLTPGRLVVLVPVLALTEAMVWGLALVRGRRFLMAKARSYRWVWSERGRIRAWRRRVFSRGRYDAGRLRAALRWSYPVGQLGVLGGERGASSRQPPGGLPV
jgi:GT2 family glycosyltransferase